MQEFQYRRKKERGQARLPVLELIKVEVLIVTRKGFQSEKIAQVKESLGREGGLAPALEWAKTFFAKQSPGRALTFVAAN
jgi:hypothetical protein